MCKAAYTNLKGNFHVQSNLFQTCSSLGLKEEIVIFNYSGIVQDFKIISNYSHATLVILEKILTDVSAETRKEWLALRKQATVITDGQVTYLS